MLDLVLPERCAICELPGRSLCDRCRTTLTRLTPPVCERCGSPGPWPVRRCAECAGRRLAFAHARSAIVYDGQARRFVRSWKERGRRRLARDAAALVAEVVPRPTVGRARPGAGRPGARVAPRRRPVPCARDRAREDLGARVRRRAGAEPRASASARAGARGAPQERPRQRRRSRAVPAQVCVVDDVYTSGATADACASACRRVGARHVRVVTLARAVR